MTLRHVPVGDLRVSATPAEPTIITSARPPIIELFREEHRADCLRIVSENYDRTMAINLDRELSEMFSNSSMPPRFLVLKEADEVCGLGCYTTSWMQYGVFEIS